MKYEPFFQVSTSRISYIPTVFEAKFQKIVDCIPFHCMQIKTFQKFHWMINQIRHRKRRQKIVIPQQSYIPVLEWFIMILLLLENSDHIIWFYFPSRGGECTLLSRHDHLVNSKGYFLFSWSKVTEIYSSLKRKIFFQ